MFPKDSPEVERVLVLGATPAMLTSLQVIEAVKLVTGIGAAYWKNAVHKWESDAVRDSGNEKKR
jgi:molybdopterin/thiamine biosynthesis adenylyltransferase